MALPPRSRKPTKTTGGSGGELGSSEGSDGSPPSDDPERLLTTKELAERIGISYGTMRNKMSAGIFGKEHGLLRIHGGVPRWNWKQFHAAGLFDSSPDRPRKPKST